MTNKKGLLATKLSYLGADREANPTAVAAAASVPSSLTMILASCTASLAYTFSADKPRNKKMGLKVLKIILSQAKYESQQKKAL